MPLTDKQARFVQEYLVDLNATQAAIRAGYSEDTARSTGSENLTKPDIAEAIATAQAERAARVRITADDVLRELVDIATVDPNELVEHRVGACRHCHGEGHRFQYTRRELEEAEALHARLNEERIAAGQETTLFDPRGGAGFSPNRAPHPDCPECHGEGQGRPVFKDTAKASPAARRLYAGVKVTRDGMEMKLHDKLAALDKIARHLGFYAPDRLEHTGRNGQPIQTEAAVRPDLSDLDQDERDLVRDLLARRLGRSGGGAPGA